MNSEIVVIKKIKTLSFPQLYFKLSLPYSSNKLFFHRLLFVLLTNRCKLSNFDFDGKLIELKFMDYSHSDIKFQQTIFKFFRTNKDILRQIRKDDFMKIYLKKYKILK